MYKNFDAKNVVNHQNLLIQYKKRKVYKIYIICYINSCCNTTSILRIRIYKLAYKCRHNTVATLPKLLIRNKSANTMSKNNFRKQIFVVNVKISLFSTKRVASQKKLFFPMKKNVLTKNKKRLYIKL
jgi:hypothetical protein